MARRLMAGILGALLLARAGAVRAENRTDPDEAMLFDLRVGRLQSSQGVGASTTKAGLCLDLKDVIAALDVALKLSPDGQRLEGWAFETGRTLSVDRIAKTVRAGDGTPVRPLKDDAIWQSSAGWCVLATDLSQWLGIRFEPDMANAILTVASDRPLPVEAAALRAENAEKLQAMEQGKPPELPQLTLPYRFWRTPALDITSDLGWRRQKNGASGATVNYEVLAAGELAWFSSDARLVSTNKGAPRSFRLRLYRDDPSGRMLGPLQATQLALGDVVSTPSALASNATPGRGITASNRPIGASARSDAIDFSGIAPKGWDAELYRNGELIRSLQANETGRYEFRDIALLTGSNNFEIVQYGPQGQIKRERKSYQIAAQLPAAGQTWWHASLVQDGMDFFEFKRTALPARSDGQWRLDAGVAHGLGKGTAISAAIHSLSRPDQGRLLIGEVEATTTLRGIVASLAAARDKRDRMAYRAKVMARAFGTSLSFETLQNRGLVSERFDAGLKAATQVSADRSVQLGKVIMPVHFDLRSTIANGEKTLAAESRLSLVTRKVAISASVGMQQTRSPKGLTLNEIFSRMLFNGRVGNIRLRGEAGFKIGPVLALDNASLTADFKIARKNVVNASVGYSRSGHVFYAGANVSRNLGFAALTAGGQIDNHRNMMATVGLQFSMGPNGKGRFGRPEAAPRAAAGQIEVAVFRDANGNGVRDGNEAEVPSPGLMLDGIPVEAPARKQAAAPQTVGSLTPALPVRLTLDESGIENPFEISSSKGFTIVPRAGVVTRVSLGITSTAAIEGRLMIDGRDAPGMAIELVDLQGKVVRQFRTDFDGFFSLERVPYGQYRLRQTGSAGPRLDIPVTASSAQPTIRLGKIQLQSPSVN